MTLMSLSSPFRRLIGRAFLVLGMAGPAIAILVLPHKFSQSVSLAQISLLPHATTVLAVLLLIGSLLIVMEKARDVGYMLGAAFYGIIVLGTVIAIFHNHGFSPLIFCLPVLVWIYAESAITATRDRENQKLKRG